jgi:hypothetical protein
MNRQPLLHPGNNSACSFFFIEEEAFQKLKQFRRRDFGLRFPPAVFNFIVLQDARTKKSVMHN